jgi:hypothetical protein
VGAINTYADLEIRILERQERGYPVEITFHGDQEFPRGFLDPLTQPQIDRSQPQESGVRMFDWLFASSELQTEIVPRSPTAIPFSVSVTPYRSTFVPLDCAVHVMPPSVVRTMTPPDPTAVPVLEFAKCVA